MTKLNRFVLMLLALSQIACGVSTQQAALDPDAMLKMSSEKVKEVSERMTNYNRPPRSIDNGKREWTLLPVTSWTSGFYPGILWLAYEYTQDEALKQKAMAFTEPISEVAYSPATDHDIGFRVYPSFVNGYRLTGNPEYKKAALSAADTLMTLFNPTVGAIHSWPSKHEYEHNTIVDNMMNLELLLWAAKNGGDKERLEHAAISHADLTQKYIVRPDSAVYHLGEFTYEGEFVRGVAHQGYADESMWARGQAWGVYGFAIVYREVGGEEFLATSMKLADHFMNRLPEDGVPYWDYDDPAIPNSPKDASASAVAAAGMLELSQLVKDEQRAEGYYQSAVKLLKAISTKEYISGDRNDAILMHSTGHHPKGWEIDVPLIYADYYYLDALLKLKKINESR